MLEIAYSALFTLIEKDHGGCDQDNCSIRQALEARDTDRAIECWLSSGAADARFLSIVDRFLAVK